MYGETKYGRMRRLAGVGTVALAVAGCAHNDVLVFGTSTTIGANLETSGGQGAPSIVIGFERQEAVWMPLLANGVESQIAACRAVDGRTCPTPAPARTGSPSESMYQSTVRENGTVVRTDSYSVFASLGASFNGRANTGVEAGAGLAQFFATGNAALNISENEALMTALKVSSPESSRAQASAVAAASGPGAFDSLMESLTPQQRADAIAYGQAQTSIAAARINRVVVCSQDPQTGAWRWPAIARAMTVSTALPPVEKSRLETIANEPALRTELRTELEWQVEAERAAKTLNFC